MLPISSTDKPRIRKAYYTHEKMRLPETIELQAVHRLLQKHFTNSKRSHQQDSDIAEKMVSYLPTNFCPTKDDGLRTFSRSDAMAQITSWRRVLPACEYRV